MKTGIINDITNLHFFTDRGYELSASKDYTLMWEIMPKGKANVDQNPKGYFIGDVDVTRKGDAGIMVGTLFSGIIDGGKVRHFEGDEAGTIREAFFDPDNIIKVTVNIQQKSFSHRCKVGDVFDCDDMP